MSGHDGGETYALGTGAATTRSRLRPRFHTVRGIPTPPAFLLCLTRPEARSPRSPLAVPFAAHAQLIPPHLRVLAVNGVNIPWNAFLSVQANKSKGEVAKIEVDDKVKTSVEEKLRV